MLLVAAPVLAETPELVATVGAEVGRAEFKVYRKSRIGELALRLSGRQFSGIWLKKSDWQRFLSKLETATTAMRQVGSPRNYGFWAFDSNASLVTGGNAADQELMNKWLKGQKMGLTLGLRRDANGPYVELKIKDFAGEVALKFSKESIAELKKAARQAKF